MKNIDNLSGTKCIKNDCSDSNHFKIKIFPHNLGEYVTNIIVEYITYNRENKENVLPYM